MSKRPRILVVDADPGYVQIVRDQLTSQGYQVAVAGNGGEAAQQARDGTVNVVILDMALPDMGGEELSTLLKERQPDVTIIAVTAQPILKSALWALQAGISAYLVKSLDLDQVLAAVREALERQHRDRQHLESVRRLEQHCAQMEQQIEGMWALNEMARAITSTLDLEQVLDLAVHRVQIVIGGEAVSLLLLDREQGDLVFHVVAGGEEDRVRPFRIKLGEGIAGWVAQEGQPLLVPDVRQDPRHYRGVDESTGFITRSILCAPMKVRDEVIGVVEVLNKATGEFTESDQQLLILAAQLSAAAIENARLFQETQELATTDGLTGLYNYRHFQTLLDTEMARAQRYQHHVALVMIDIDHFKEINDAYGQQVGDHVLVELGGLLRGTSRRTDYAARYGGEGFAIILPETPTRGAIRMAERLRHVVAQHEFAINPAHSIRLTVSLGVVASVPDEPETKEELIRRADRALYRAKLRGRDQVCTDLMTVDGTEADTSLF